jgi:hypothetical protein
VEYKEIRGMGAGSEKLSQLSFFWGGELV